MQHPEGPKRYRVYPEPTVNGYGAAAQNKYGFRDQRTHQPTQSWGENFVIEILGVELAVW